MRRLPQGGIAMATEIRHAWCQMCGPAKTRCSLLCRIEDGRWVGVEGNPVAGNNGGRGGRSICAKANAAIQALYDPSRLTHPLRRVGDKGAGRQAFERCSWDEALDDIAQRLAAIKSAHGAAAFGILSPQFYNVLATFGRRFLNVFGSPNYLHSGICALQRRASKTVCIGDAECAPAQMDKTKLLVNWGANPENSGVNLGKPADRLDAQAGGMRVIDIRPMMDPLAARADMWLPVRPGTDGALALAILHVIIGEDLYDHAFVGKWCWGFDDLARHVQRFTPEWAQGICGIPAQRIVEAARLMGTVRPMGILYGNGIGDQQRDGNWTCIAICLIEAITGNLGIPGGGQKPRRAKPLVRLNKIDLLSDRLPKSPQDETMGWTAGASNLVAPEMPRWYQSPATWESGPNSAYFPALTSALSDSPNRLRAVFAQATNPLGATRQPKLVAQALDALELYVVMDTHWNPSCAWADYVLPACTHYEISHQIGVVNTARGTFVGITQPLAKPLGESRSDWQFYLDLAVRMGFGADFWNGDMDACLREQLEGTGIDLETLRERGFVFIEREQPSAAEGDGATGESDAPSSEPDYAKMFARLPHGKVQCRNEWIGGKPNASDTGALPYLPEYAGPPEGLAETPELAQRFPLVFSDVHAYHLCNHSYYVGLPWLRELQPYPWVKINPRTAKRCGIADGDWVRITSPHGWIVLRAELFEGIAPDVLMARRGWWQDCAELGLPGYGCFDGGCESSVLYSTDPSMFDPFHSAMPKQTLVRIEKWEGDAPSAQPSGLDPKVPPRTAAAGAPQAAGASQAASALRQPDGEGAENLPRAPRGFTIDPTRCIACHACVVACKQSRQVPAGRPAPCRLVEKAEGAFPDVRITYAPTPCGACADPACAATCPTGALRFAKAD